MDASASVESHNWLNDVKSTKQKHVEMRIVHYLQGLGLEYRTEPTQKQDQYFQKNFTFNITLNQLQRNRGLE